MADEMSEAGLPRIPVDFNTAMADPLERVYINTTVHPEVLGALQPGCTVVLYEEGDIAVRATVEYDEEHDKWFGMPDWSTLQYL